MPNFSASSDRQVRIQRELLDLLVKHRGPHRGLEIPLDTDQAASLPLVLAAQQLAKDHPELTLITVGNQLTLAFRDDVGTGLHTDTLSILKANGNLR